MKSPDYQDLYQTLLDASFHFVSFRPRSEKEIRSFLVKKLSRFSVIPANKFVIPAFTLEGEAGIQAPLLDRVMNRLRELDYVNDEKFAAWWVDQRQTHKPKGIRLLTQELKAKGVPDDLIKTLLGKRRDQLTCGRNEIDTLDERTLAMRALEKKLPHWQRLSKLDKKKKIYGFLGRRGFDSEVIHRVIDEVVSGKVQS